MSLDDVEIDPISTDSQQVAVTPTDWPSGELSPSSATPRPAPETSDAESNRIPAVLGILCGAAISVSISVLAPKDSSLARMFDWHKIESLIPAIILAVFLWGLFACLRHAARIKTIARACDFRLLKPIIAALTSENRPEDIEKTVQDVMKRQRGSQRSPLLRRVSAAIQQWNINPNLQDVDVILQQHIEHDEGVVHSTYSLMRLFVWALPVMGLIGTVIGISLAVGGFARFLSGSIDDVAVIKTNLVGVTGGLSFAFLITLEGLATSLILMFLTSGLERRENQILLQVQKQISDELLPVLQAGVQQVPLRSTIVGVDQTRELLLDLSKEIFAVIQNAADKLLAGIGANLQAQSSTVTRATGQMETGTEAMLQAISQATTYVTHAYEQFKGDTIALYGVISGQRDIFDVMLGNHKDSIEKAQGLLTSAIEQETRIVANNAQAVSQLVSATQAAVESHKAAQREVFHEMLTSHKAAVDNAQTELTAALNAQTQVVSGHTQALSELVSATKSVMESHSTVVAEMGAVDLVSPVETMAELSSQLDSQTRQMVVLVQAFDSMLRSTEAMTNSHQALHIATKQLHDVGLGQTLVSVRDSLTAIMPTLEGFRKPLVLRMVPVDGEERR